MNAREIVNKLIGGEIKLSQALQYAKLLMIDSQSVVHADWVRSECDGYKDPLSLPQYRVFPCSLYSHNSVAFYGEQVKPVDAHEVDEQYKKESGISLYKMYVREGIESIESVLENLNGETIQMSLPEHINTAFRESYTNPSVAILEVYQQAPAAYFIGILTSVKNELINILISQAMEDNSIKKVGEDTFVADSGSYKSVFISYSYDNHNHEQWVKHFADTLKAHGVKVTIDKDLPYGGNLTQFMVKGITSSDVVLIIGTPNYLAKVNESKTTGVKFEDVIITDRLMNDIDTTKFVPILRAGTFHTSFAPLIEHRKGIDFSCNDTFNENMKELLEVALKR